MNDSDFGKLIFRITIAVLLFFHGYAKITYGLGFIEDALSANNLPEFLSYFVYIGEILAPLLLIIGYKTRLAATTIILSMIFAIYLVFPNDLTTISSNGTLKLELTYFYIFTSLSLIFLGAGKYSLDRR
ncbi:MAG: DoxX family protein [Campylobacteraceae bacterium]|nr:DoxX family protein [Campylobacteraceae bacterium]